MSKDQKLYGVFQEEVKPGKWNVGMLFLSSQTNMCTAFKGASFANVFTTQKKAYEVMCEWARLLDEQGMLYGSGLFEDEEEEVSNA